MKAVRQLKTQAGFSLIELMIVVAIIGILASIAVPNFQKFQRRAKQSEGKGYLAGVYTAENGFRAEWNAFTGDLVCIGFKDPVIAAGADGIAGRGNYRVGFTAAGGLSGPASGTTCIAGNFSAAPAPAGGAAIPGAVAGPTVITNTNFTAAVSGALGGAAQDNWTITDTKIVTNTLSGL